MLFPGTPFQAPEQDGVPDEQDDAWEELEEEEVDVSDIAEEASRIDRSIAVQLSASCPDEAGASGRARLRFAGLSASLTACSSPHGGARP